MPTLQNFFDAGKSIIAAGAAANASGRQEIRDIVGQLADELERALFLADAYLAGARHSRDDQELIQYLQAADGKLMSSFYENNICAGIYRLADKFEQIFDPARFSVSITSYFEIPRLIDRLKNGERAVLDDLDETVRQLKDHAYKLVSALPQQQEMIRLDIDKAIEYHRHELAEHRKSIKKLRRKIVDSI